ncbi:MAG: hypothetical protein GWN87_29740 [Desulfuromonadales bacterium]|nr:hypothetical protein [Desulfuromonadales bacterium]
MRISLLLVVVAILGGVFSMGCSKELPPEKKPTRDLRVSAETVHSWLTKGRDVLFVDIRAEGDWQASNEQLPGAVRVHTYQGVENLIQTLSSDRLIVAYCT